MLWFLYTLGRRFGEGPPFRTVNEPWSCNVATCDVFTRCHPSRGGQQRIRLGLCCGPLSTQLLKRLELCTTLKESSYYRAAIAGFTVKNPIWTWVQLIARFSCSWFGWKLTFCWSVKRFIMTALISWEKPLNNTKFLKMYSWAGINGWYLIQMLMFFSRINRFKFQSLRYGPFSESASIRYILSF